MVSTLSRKKNVIIFELLRVKKKYDTLMKSYSAAHKVSLFNLLKSLSAVESMIQRKFQCDDE